MAILLKYARSFSRVTPPVIDVDSVLSDDTADSHDSTVSLIHTAHNISLHDESDHVEQQQTNDKPNQPPAEQEHKLKTNDIPCRLKAAGPSKPVHEVYIGGLEYGTSEDDARACLMVLNVDNIRKVNKISDDQSASSSFHVIIVADTIKETVYGVEKFPLGVIVKPFRLYSQDGANKHKHLISTKKVDAKREMPMYNSAGTNTYPKFSTNNRHSRTHPFSAPRWRGRATNDNKEFNSVPNHHSARVYGRQQTQTSHLDYTPLTQTVQPDYRQPQMMSSQHHDQPQHSSVTPLHSTSYSYSPPMNMHTQQTIHNNYHRPEMTKRLPYPVTEYNNDRAAQMLPYPINNNISYPSNQHRY